MTGLYSRRLCRDPQDLANLVGQGISTSWNRLKVVASPPKKRSQDSQVCQVSLPFAQRACETPPETPSGRQSQGRWRSCSRTSWRSRPVCCRSKLSQPRCRLSRPASYITPACSLPSTCPSGGPADLTDCDIYENEASISVSVCAKIKPVPHSALGRLLAESNTLPVARSLQVVRRTYRSLEITDSLCDRTAVCGRE